MQIKTTWTEKKWLWQTLLLSASLNLVLLSIFFYFFVRGNPLTLSFEYTPDVYKEEKKLTNEALLMSFAKLSFPELTSKLKDETLIEYGYKVRDLALTLLVKKHHFDLQRALGRQSIPKRLFQLSTGEEIALFPGLSPQDFEKIVRFTLAEKWPLTSEGLFMQLKKNGMKSDPTLLLAFSRTPEFFFLETLFSRTHLPIKKKFLLTLVSEGDWKGLAELYEKTKQDGLFSDERRQELLLRYISNNSKTGCYLLLITDPVFAVQKLDDRTACRILLLTTEKTKESVRFAQILLNSPRSDAVLSCAAKRLLEYQGGAPEVAQRPGPRPAVGELRPTFRDRLPASPTTSQHIVLPGETLLSIARRHHVTVEQLKAINHLQGQTVKPGKTLKLP